MKDFYEGVKFGMLVFIFMVAISVDSDRDTYKAHLSRSQHECELCKAENGKCNAAKVALENIIEDMVAEREQLLKVNERLSMKVITLQNRGE